jgi:hypothetical protein
MINLEQSVTDLPQQSPKQDVPKAVMEIAAQYVPG